MLFAIPVEDKPSWRRPPVVCALLILANLALYGYFEAQDKQAWERAQSLYHESGLSTREWPMYIGWLRDNDPEQWGELHTVEAEDINDAATDTLTMDRSFERWLHTQPAPADQQLLRRKFEDVRNQLSDIRFGTTPGDPHPQDMFTSMFMHGSWEHVLGNMLFLLLFGIALETRLGSFILLLLYLACGLAANAADVLLRPGSMIPAVGASGAVAGLMGMYVGLYGTKVREFFVMLGPWVGSLRMPAIIVFGLWLGKEVLDGLYANDHVGHWAHAGGLVAGFLLALPFRGRALHAASETQHHDDGVVGHAATDTVSGAKNTTKNAGNSSVPAPRKPAPAVPAGLRKLAEQGEFEKVVAACVERIAAGPVPEEFRLFYFDNAARAGEKPLLQAASQWLAPLKNVTPVATAPEYAAAAAGYEKLVALRTPFRKLSPQYRLLLCELQLHTGYVKDAFDTLKQLLHEPWRHPRLARIALDIAKQLPDAGDAEWIRREVASSTATAAVTQPSGTAAPRKPGAP